ncbi:hypothetical protein Y032_0649g1125 [Ancylostoma ceylanicum]|nr:hypothetical protein Y032_0649g1125 [Ancylostoma ceylanicum]
MKDSNVTHCLSNLRPDIGLVRTYNIDCDDSGNMCTGMIAASEEGRAIYIVFRDTASRKQPVVLPSFFRCASGALAANLHLHGLHGRM